MTLRRRVSRNTTARCIECRTGIAWAIRVHPHETQLEVEERQRKWRDTAVPAAAFQVQQFCGVDLSALGIEPEQGRDIFKTLTTVLGCLQDGKGFIVATEGLEDRRAFAIYGLDFDRELLATI